MEKMARAQKILEHPLFVEGLANNIEEEKERIFCHHDMIHFLQVARLAYIFSLERQYRLDKEVIYAAALLHDIGKWQQYKEGIPHEIASADIAKTVLEETGFSEEEINMILAAIRSHRSVGATEPLSEVLYDADKISRDCYACAAQKECNWSNEKKNLQITW